MSENSRFTRRRFIKSTIAGAAGFSALNALSGCSAPEAEIEKPGDAMKLGLVTYLWGQDWDLPTLIKNCQDSGLLAVELRTEHAHGVEPSLSAAEREEVKKRFMDSPVTCVGYGSNALPEGVPPEQTLEQIGTSLNTVGKYAQDYGQEIRVEVHGRETQLPENMKKIFDHVTEPNVKICWNCNNQDLVEPGLEYNFNMLKGWFGDTVHIRELNEEDYPYQQLFDLFVGINYGGWILLEARTKPEDRVSAMKEQKMLFNEIIAKAQEKLG